MSCELATFHGRPPGLSLHYISSQLPLGERPGMQPEVT